MFSGFMGWMFGVGGGIAAIALLSSGEWEFALATFLFSSVAAVMIGKEINDG